MSVQVRRRRESAAFLASFVGAQGELLVDTTNNRVQVHDGATPGGWPAAKLADVAQRTAVADANYTALANDRTIAVTALTAARIVTLPAASAYPTGTQLLVVDESGACSPALTVTLARAGTDTINGLASATIASAYGFLALTSNGKAAWTLVDFTGATVAQLANRNAALNGNFAVNQRGYASGAALAAGAYGHDRWKAGANGCTYAFTSAVPDTSISITAGSLVQAIDAPNVYATSWWLTWTGTATARVWQGSASGAFLAGIALAVGGTAVNALLVTGLTPGTIATIEFSTGTCGLVQMEAALPNAGPTRFERRHNELALCQRYYVVAASSPGCVGVGTSPTFFTATFTFPVVMRATPTLILLNGSINGGSALEVQIAQRTITQPNTGTLTTSGGRWDFTTSSGFTAAGKPMIVEAGAIGFSAEL